jgi:hypothetical protein
MIKNVCYWYAPERTPQTPEAPNWYVSTLDEHGLLLSSVERQREEEARRFAEQLASENSCEVFPGSPKDFRAQ